MRRNTDDKTLEENYKRKWIYLIEEYKQIKSKQHPRYKFVKDFYEDHHIQRQNFIKVYNRFNLQGHKQEALIPQKRGPKWGARRPLPFIENQVVKLRETTQANRYEIHRILKDKLHKFTPSPSGVYTILKRHKLNKLHPKVKEEKRKIIKDKMGELGHIDIHYLPKTLIHNVNKRYYLLGCIDACTRVVWVEVLDNIKSLSAMFASMQCFLHLGEYYSIKFKEILTDNGSEFSSRSSKSKLDHPFERLLIEMDIKHRLTKPYRPQTNGKIERFWKTIEEELIEETYFESIDMFKDELLKYLIYYNEHRPHQGIHGKTPKEMVEILSSN